MRRVPNLPAWAYRQGILAGGPHPRRNRGCVVAAVSLLLAPVLLCGAIGLWYAVADGVERRDAAARMERVRAEADREQSPVAAAGGPELAGAVAGMSPDELSRAIDPLVLAEQVRYDGNGEPPLEDIRERVVGGLEGDPAGYRVYEDETGEASTVFDMASGMAPPEYLRSERVLVATTIPPADGVAAGYEVLGFRESSPGSSRWWLVGVTVVYP